MPFVMLDGEDEETFVWGWQDPLANPLVKWSLFNFDNLWSYPAGELAEKLSDLERRARDLKDVIAAQNEVIHPFFPDNHAADKVAREMHCIGLSKSKREKFDAERILAKELRNEAKEDLVANILDQAKIISELEGRNMYYL